MKKKVKFDKNKVKDVSKKIPKRIPNAIFYSGAINDGCTAWRMRFPQTALDFNNRSSCQLTTLIQPPFTGKSQTGQLKVNPNYCIADSVIVQRPVSKEHLNFFQASKACKNAISRLGHTPFRLVVDSDDIIKPSAMHDYGVFDTFTDERWETFKECVKLSDELHVCSTYMRDFYKEEIGVEHVTYKPNLMHTFMYDYYNYSYGGVEELMKYKKPRVLWAGSFTHIDTQNRTGGKDDLTHIIDVIIKTIDEYQWVFFGSELPQALKPYKSKIELHPWVGIYYYPQKVMSLNVDCMIAPLQDNTFNRAKSNIKLIEAGALGIPVICQDLEPYKEAPLKFNTGDDLMDQLKMIIEDADHYMDVIRKQKKIADEYWIESEENLDLIMASLYTEINSPQRLKMSKKLVEINS